MKCSAGIFFSSFWRARCNQLKSYTSLLSNEILISSVGSGNRKKSVLFFCMKYIHPGFFFTPPALIGLSCDALFANARLNSCMTIIILKQLASIDQFHYFIRSDPLNYEDDRKPDFFLVLSLLGTKLGVFSIANLKMISLSELQYLFAIMIERKFATLHIV